MVTVAGRRSHYDVLGVASDATEAEIRWAWRKAMRRVHPDAGGTLQDAQVVNEAHRVLSDPLRRADYNLELRRQGLWVPRSTEAPPPSRTAGPAPQPPPPRPSSSEASTGPSNTASGASHSEHEATAAAEPRPPWMQSARSSPCAIVAIVAAGVFLGLMLVILGVGSFHPRWLRQSVKDAFELSFFVSVSAAAAFASHGERAWVRTARFAAVLSPKRHRQGEQPGWLARLIAEYVVGLPTAICGIGFGIPFLIALPERVAERFTR